MRGVSDGHAPVLWVFVLDTGDGFDYNIKVIISAFGKERYTYE